MKRLLHYIIAIPLFISLLFSQIAFASNSTLERINKNGEIIIGMSGEQPPFNFVSNADMIIGYDVQLATLLAASLKVKLRIELMPFAQLMAALEKNEIDAIVSGFAFTEDRSEKITFVGPYALSGKSLLLNNETLKKIKASTGFNHKDVHLMALENSTSIDLAKARLGDAKLTPIKHYEDALIALRAGTVDALVADLAVCELAVIRDTTHSLTTLPKPLAVEEVGIAINKDEPQLENLLSAQLRELTTSGQLNALHERWFNSPEWLSLLP